MKKIVFAILCFIVIYCCNSKVYCQVVCDIKINEVTVFNSSDVSTQATIDTKNSLDDENTSAGKLGEINSWGIGMRCLVMSISFLLLIIIYLFLRQLGVKFLGIQKGKALLKESNLKKEASQVQEETSDGINAAIGLALYMYTSELHDFEEAVLTINKVSRVYSPWSSKIYGLRQTPERK